MLPNSLPDSDDPLLSTGRRRSEVLPFAARCNPAGPVSVPQGNPRWGKSELCQGLTAVRPPWLHVALSRGDEEAVEALLTYGPEVVASSWENVSALKAAVLTALAATPERRGSALEMADRLLVSAGPALEKEGPVLLAAAAFDPEVRARLLAAGASPLDGPGNNLPLLRSLYAGRTGDTAFWEPWGLAWPASGVDGGINPWSALLHHLPGMQAVLRNEGRWAFGTFQSYSEGPKITTKIDPMDADQVRHWAKRMADAGGAPGWLTPMSGASKDRTKEGSGSNEDQETVLVRTCKWGAPESVRFLLNMGAPVNANEQGKLVLLWIWNLASALRVRLANPAEDDPSAWLGVADRLWSHDVLATQVGDLSTPGQSPAFHLIAGILSGPCSDRDESVRAWGWEKMNRWFARPTTYTGTKTNELLDAVLEYVLERRLRPQENGRSSDLQPADWLADPRWRSLFRLPCLHHHWCTSGQARTPRAWLKARAEGRVRHEELMASGVPWTDWCARDGSPPRFSLCLLLEPSLQSEEVPAFPLDTWQTLSELRIADESQPKHPFLVEAFAVWSRQRNALRPNLGDMLDVLVQQGLGLADVSESEPGVLSSGLMKMPSALEEIHLRCCWNALRGVPMPHVQNWPNWARTHWQTWNAADLQRQLGDGLSESGQRSRLRM